MKKFYLLRLQFGDNVVICEVTAINEGVAINAFQQLHPELNLNNNGYAQIHDPRGISYCVARQFGE